MDRYLNQTKIKVYYLLRVATAYEISSYYDILYHRMIF